MTAIDAPHATEFARLPFGTSVYQTDARHGRGRPKLVRNDEKRLLVRMAGILKQVEAVYMPLAQMPYWNTQFDVVIAGRFLNTSPTR